MGFPERTAGAADRRWLEDVLAVAGSRGALTGANAVAAVRMSWWRSLWNQPLGPLLAGAVPLVLPESAEETEHWRVATVEALGLPDVRDAVRELVQAGTDVAVDVLRARPELLDLRWHLTVDLFMASLRDSQESEEAATAVDELWRLVRRARLMGVDGVATYEDRHEHHQLVSAALAERDANKRIEILERLWSSENAGPLEVTAGLTLVQSLHGRASRSAADAERLVALAREVAQCAQDALGQEHQLALSAQLNLAVALDEMAPVGASSEAEQLLGEIAPLAADHAPSLVPDVMTDLATIAAVRPATPADNPDEAGALLADADHIRALITAPGTQRRQLAALTNEAAVLRSRVSGSRRENAHGALSRLREVISSEEGLSEAERVLVRSNLCNALRELYGFGDASAADVRASAEEAITAASALDRLNPVGIQTLANAGAVLTDLYVETVRAHAPQRALWEAARDALEHAFEAARDAYQPGHDETLRAAVNLAAAYGAPVEGQTADAARCEELLEYVLREAPADRARHRRAAAMNLIQLRIGQGRYDEAAQAATAAEEAQAALLRSARTYVTRLGTIVAGGDAAARHALTLVAADRPSEAIAVLEANRARLAERRPGLETPQEPGTAVVHLATADYGTLGVVQLSGGEYRTFITTLAARSLKALVAGLLTAPDAAQRRLRFDRLADTLTHAAADPLVQLLEGMARVDLILCGALASCPVALVPTTAGPSLAASFEVRELVAANGSQPPTLPDPARALALVDPDGTLPFARAEREAVMRWANEVISVEGGPGARSAVLGGLTDATAAHLSCHGRLDPEDPMASRFGLGVDAPVTVADLSEISAPHLELVVAPACQAASASPDAPDELLGAGHALIHAGARTVVASLWDADDAATALVVARLYKALGDGRVPHLALSDAHAWAAHVTTAELAALSAARLTSSVEAMWLPYDLAIEFTALVMHPEVRDLDTPLFAHPTEWGALSCLEA